ncbi:MAG TPA: HNH endonuclease signature motif containing protein [Vicinamibacterales bacterium]|nr:HNH endonuclease signature motif containing protein [Vicinamibacterales bacterium]
MTHRRSAWSTFIAVIIMCVVALAITSISEAKGHGSKGSSAKAGSKTVHVKAAKSSAASRANAQPRDAKGRFIRSAEAKRAFETQSGYPHGRPGYVVDHVKPLACGGADAPSNMQWQTIAEGKAKDKWERVGCR